MVSRYDTVTGKKIKIEDRIGLLDRKLRIVTENNYNKEEWVEWSIKAIKSIYGFDWQGDNVLLSRENILYTYIDYYYNKFNEKPDIKLIKKVAKVISWNIWQMDGIKYVIPNSEVHSRIMNWDTNRKVKFEYSGIFNEILNEIGLMPLPPYIHEKLKEKDRYQTVYAKYEGSAAAPTAGLHFTDKLFEKLKEKGVEVANVTLHVGIGTFRPVKVENIEEHDMHSEHFYIKAEDAEKINKAKKEGHRVIAVGTTSCRVLESIADENGYVKEVEGDTSIFIYPGYKFKCLDALITNFHLPESTLIMLVSALAGKDFIMQAYEEAVKEQYKFFSFGDAMFIY